MDGPGPDTLFVGDLGDPWVAAIADALPPGSRRQHCQGELPEPWPAAVRAARTVVLHRAAVGLGDADRLRSLKEPTDAPAPKVVLCLGQHVRQRQVERCTPFVDLILPEATAAWTIARHVAAEPARPAPPPGDPSVVIVSHHSEMRAMLADACRRGGFGVRPARDWSTAALDGLALWEVPTLEPDWPHILRAEARHRPVLALLGFADRALVATAREAGAIACLDLPCDPHDLAWLIDRITRQLQDRPARAAGRSEPGHAVPPRPAGSRRARRQPIRRPDSGPTSSGRS